jgi:hypothetical protein
VNPEKHRKPAASEWLEADESDVPTRARSPHIVGHYIKNHRKQSTGARARPATVLLQVSGEPKRVQEITEELNRRLHLLKLPLRFRVVSPG